MSLKPLSPAILREAATMIRQNPGILISGLYESGGRYCAVGLLYKLVGGDVNKNYNKIDRFQVDVVTPYFRDAADFFSDFIRDSERSTLCDTTIVAGYSNWYVDRDTPLKVAELFELVADRVEQEAMAV